MNEESAARLFDTLFEEHRRVLYAYLLGRVGDKESAEDMLQETFVRVWRHIEEVAQIPVERRRFWLLPVAGNLARVSRRRQAVRERGEVAGTSLLSVPDPERLVLARAAADRLDDAICRLPDTLRTVLTLHVLGDLTSAQVGQLLERPAGTVRYQLAQARRLLREVMAEG